MDNKASGLQTLVTTFQRRWGTKALRRLSRDDIASRAASVPTGFLALDNLFPGGGLPRGAITEITGRSTCGMTTLALRIAARAQAERDTVVYLDCTRTFDPLHAKRCGIKLSHLLLVRPSDGPEALSIIYDLVASGGVGLLIVHSITHLLPSPDGIAMLHVGARRLHPILPTSPCALLSLVPYTTSPSLFQGVALRFHIRGESLIRQRGVLSGYRVTATLTHSKSGHEGLHIFFTIPL